MGVFEQIQIFKKIDIPHIEKDTIIKSGPMLLLRQNASSVNPYCIEYILEKIINNDEFRISILKEMVTNKILYNQLSQIDFFNDWVEMSHNFKICI